MVHTYGFAPVLGKVENNKKLLIGTEGDHRALGVEVGLETRCLRECLLAVLANVGSIEERWRVREEW